MLKVGGVASLVGTSIRVTNHLFAVYILPISVRYLHSLYFVSARDFELRKRIGFKSLNVICFAWNGALGRARKVKTGSVCATAQADHGASPFIS